MSYNWSNPVDFSSGFGADTQGAFKDITSFLPAKQGGNMLLAPLAAPLITGLFSAGTSMFGANQAQQAAKRSEKLAKENAFLNFFQAGELFTENILKPKAFANQRDDLRARIGIEGSSAARELRQEANREALKRSIAEKQGAMRGMFGPIAPIDVSTIAV